MLMKSRVIAIWFALHVFVFANFSFATELVATGFGVQASTLGSTGFVLSNNGCQACVTDGDLITAWDVSGTQPFSEGGEMHMSLFWTFVKPADIDSLSLRVAVDANSTAGSTRLNQGDYQFQYRVSGQDYVTFLSDSFGPTTGGSPVSVSYNGTVSGLDLKNIASLRLLTNVSVTDGSGLATSRMRMYHIGATGTLVPEPSVGSLLMLGVVGGGIQSPRRLRNDCGRHGRPRP
jgi:hypothetical protein